MKADESFNPKSFSLDFAPHYRHFDRYMKAINLLGRLGKGEHWADYACGYGYGTELLEKFCSKVTGIDVNRDAIFYNNSHVLSANIDFYLARVGKQINPNYNSKFDVVFCIETIEHLKPGESANFFLLQLRNICKQGGEVVFSTPLPEVTNKNPANDHHFIEYSLKDFETLLTSCGFKITKTELVETTFTDGEKKNQGFIKCQLI